MLKSKALNLSIRALFYFTNSHVMSSVLAFKSKSAQIKSFKFEYSSVILATDGLGKDTERYILLLGTAIFIIGSRSL